MMLTDGTKINEKVMNKYKVFLNHRTFYGTVNSIEIVQASGVKEALEIAKRIYGGCGIIIVNIEAFNESMTPTKE